MQMLVRNPYSSHTEACACGARSFEAEVQTRLKSEGGTRNCGQFESWVGCRARFLVCHAPVEDSMGDATSREIRECLLGELMSAWRKGWSE